VLKKLFKTTDDKLLELGFSKEHENRYGARYTREEATYTHVVDIAKKSFGRSILQSYDKDLMDASFIGNIGVGLTYKEMKLFTKKMKEMKLDKE